MKKNLKKIEIKETIQKCDKNIYIYKQTNENVKKELKEDKYLDPKTARRQGERRQVRPNTTYTTAKWLLGLAAPASASVLAPALAWSRVREWKPVNMRRKLVPRTTIFLVCTGTVMIIKGDIDYISVFLIRLLTQED